MKPCGPVVIQLEWKVTAVKIRKGWKITLPDGTTWLGDCAKWAAGPLMPGAKIEPVRILGTGKWLCSACALGVRH